jgi:probable selenium-dependent hydroxylase accessory protein YqeC
LNLYSALGVVSGDVVAFAGAGGKSSAIREISAELREAGYTVLVAPTTKMLIGEADGIGPLATSESLEGLLADAEGAISGSGAAVIGSERLSKNRIAGIKPAWFSSLSSLADVVLIEADGSRHRPLKGTADHEPAIPEAATLVIAVGNISAFGKPVGEEHIHRPAIFSELTGVGSGQSVTANAFARALAHGSLRNLPPGARPAVLITGVEPGDSMAEASIVTRELWRMGIQQVVLTSLSAEAPVQVWVP